MPIGRDMTLAVSILWAAFWLYWLIAALGAKKGSRSRRRRAPALVVLVAAAVLRVFRTGSLAVHNPALRAAGVALLVIGLGVAVWARIYLGRNWGMPMTEKEQPELVTSGPYRFVRHPIYSGLLLAMAGSALATSIYWLVALGAVGGYFLYSAWVEERLLSAEFPTAYPSYRARTKMLIPFLL
jgi:protein-S-isoprenylcysteine O-methyltransferase Ste14